MTRTGRGAIALGIGAFLLAPPASHGAPSHIGGEGLIDVRSAAVPVDKSFTISMSASAYSLDAVKDLDLDSGSRSVIDGGLHVTAALLGWAEGFGRIDFTRSSADGGLSTSGLSDGLVGVKVEVPWTKPWIHTGVAASLNVPWGKRDEGLSTGSVDPEITALVTFPLPESNTLTAARLHVNFGYHFFGDTRGRGFEGNPGYFLDPVYPAEMNDRINTRVGIELAARDVTFFTEFVLDFLRSQRVAFFESPLFLNPGFRVALGDSYSVLLGSRISLASDDNSTRKFRPPEQLYPDWQFVFGLTWSRSGPDVDRDRDGVPDFRDACPRRAEDRDGFEDDDGCPESDNDGDGIPDEFDGSPNDAEDLDGHLDYDGVPDPDNDGDGIPDETDACPDDAEDPDGIADADGCPELDADNDRVPDTRDDCPEEAEDRNGVDDEDGCPETIGLREPSVLRTVTWQGAEVSPTPGSFAELRALADLMKATPDLSVRLRVHPIRMGDGSESSPVLRLAEQRADYVKGFLIAAGIDASRLFAEGLSKASPQADWTPEELRGTGVLEIIPSRE